MPEAAAEALARRVSEYPPNALPFFQSAFATASRLNEDVFKNTLEEIQSDLEKGNRYVGGIELKSVAGLNSREQEQLTAVFSLLIGLLSETSSTPEDFLSAARDRLFLSKDEAAARAIASTICSRAPDLQAAVERAQLAGSVLPSLTGFTIAVDLRVKISSGRVKMGVPVAVVHIDTDGSDEIWLQLSQSDVQSLVTKLGATLDDMRVAETLLVSRA